jgi:hypothetical protein
MSANLLSCESQGNRITVEYGILNLRPIRACCLDSNTVSESGAFAYEV